MNAMLEVAGSSIIGGMIVLMILQTNITITNSVYYHTLNTANQINLTTIAQVIDNDIKNAGYRVTDSIKIYSTDSTNLCIRHDIDDNGVVDSVRYAAFPGRDSDILTLKRIVNGNTSAATEFPVTDFVVRYYDSNGRPTTFRSTVRLVKVAFTTITEQVEFAEGTLKTQAMSGANGGQYVTNPSLLRYPLSGVTYVELPAGGTRSPANIEGTGILIVHNAAQNAVIRNINFGTFKGLLMADDIDKIHNTIIGAVIGLSPFPPSGNCIGNGSGNVLYSSQVLTSTTATVSGTGGSANVLAWKE